MFQSRLHHVGIIVPSLEQVELLLGLLGLRRGSEQYVAEYEADCYFTSGTDEQHAAIEFIVPRGGKLATFNKGVGGLHHIALEVDNLADATAALNDRGVKLLEQQPVDAGPILINFVPPLYTRGLVVELIERKTGATLRHHIAES